MKIEATEKANSLFWDLEIGDSFWAEGELYLKIDEDGDDNTNAVRFRDGTSWHHTDHTHVVRAQVKVVDADE